MIPSYKTKSPKGVISDLVVVLVAQSCLTLVTPWSIACQAPLSMGFFFFFSHGILRGRILEWVAISSSRGSSWPRKRTQISRTAGRFFTNWATRETPKWQLISHVDSLQPQGLYSPWNSPGQNTGVGSCSLLQGIPQPRDRTQSPTLQADYLPAEQPGKPIWWVYWIKVNTLVMVEYWKIN